MAGIAERRRPGISSVRMAGGATGRDMSSGQWIARLGSVIEARGRPSGGIMADRTNEAERRRRVNRVVRPGEIIMMAGIAGRGRAGVPLAVAFQTARARMRAG